MAVHWHDKTVEDLTEQFGELLKQHGEDVKDAVEEAWGMAWSIFLYETMTAELTEIVRGYVNIYGEEEVVTAVTVVNVMDAALDNALGKNPESPSPELQDAPNAET